MSEQVPLYEMRLRSEYEIGLTFHNEIDENYQVSAVNPAFMERKVGVVDDNPSALAKAAHFALEDVRHYCKRKLLHPPRGQSMFYRVDDGSGRIIDDVGHDWARRVVPDTPEFIQFVEMGEARRKTAMERLNDVAECLDSGIIPDRLFAITDKRDAADLLTVDTALAKSWGMLAETCHNKETRAAVEQHVGNVLALSAAQDSVAQTRAKDTGWSR